MKERVECTVEGLNVTYVADKLKKAEIRVFHAKRKAKNIISLQVERKDLEKVFAILRGSCYNIGGIRPKGLFRLKERCLRSAGLIVGAALFACSAVYAETRVLKIEVTGSGAYYEAEALAVLSENGVKTFSPMPRDTAPLSAEILSFPCVSFCSFRHTGGVLTVEIQVSDENAFLSGECLYAPASGTVTELIVIRGTACVKTGEEIEKDAVAVKNTAAYGETERTVAVIAGITVCFAVSKEYTGTEEEAAAQAFLEYGEIENYAARKTAEGWLVTGTASASASVNFQ